MQLMRTPVCSAALLLAVTVAGGAIDLRIHAGPTYIGHVADLGVGPPSSLVELVGAGVRLWQEPLGDTFFLAWASDLSFYGTYYEWSSVESRPTPTEAETAGGMWVLGGLLGTDFAIGWTISPSVSLALSAGLDLSLRAPLFVDDAAGAEDAANASTYFYSAARFLLPRNELRVEWAAFSQMAVSVAFRIYYPLFHAWDGEDRPFADQLLLSGIVGVSIPLGG
jgi:hypothetical protein